MFMTITVYSYMYFTTLRAAVYESAANAEQPSRPRMMSRSRAQPLLLLLLHGLLASAHESGDGGVGGRVATAATGVLQPAEKGMVSPRRRELRTGSSVVAQGGNLHAMQAAGCRDDPTGYLARMRAWYGATDTCSNMVQRTGCAHAWGGGNHLVADHCPFSCFSCSSQKYDALNRLFLHVAIPVGDIDGVYDSGAVRVDLKKLVCKDLSVGSLHLAGSGPTAGHNPQEVRARLQARDVMITCSTTVVWRLGSIVEDETTGEVSTTTTSIDGTVVFQSPNFATTPPRTATVVCDSNSIVLGQLTGPDLSGSSFTTRVANLGLSIGWLEQKVQNKLSDVIREVLCDKVMQIATGALQTALRDADVALAPYLGPSPPVPTPLQAERGLQGDRPHSSWLALPDTLIMRLVNHVVQTQFGTTDESRAAKLNEWVRARPDVSDTTLPAWECLVAWNDSLHRAGGRWTGQPIQRLGSDEREFRDC
jgi:hypothetical protein